MARLIAFLACEKAVIEQRTNAVSIFSVLQTIQILIPSGQTNPPPQGAVAPLNWMTISIWLRENENEPTFELKHRFESPSGEVLFETPVITGVFEPAVEQHRILGEIAGMPISTPGKCMVRLMKKDQGQTDFSDVARFPIMIQYINQPPAS